MIWVIFATGKRVNNQMIKRFIPTAPAISLKRALVISRRSPMAASA